jgi:hypothetical protein
VNGRLLYLIWLVVWNMIFFSIHWEFHLPNWLIFFQMGWNHQPVMFKGRTK